jgi:hypothetical protein
MASASPTCGVIAGIVLVVPCAAGVQTGVDGQMASNAGRQDDRQAGREREHDGADEGTPAGRPHCVAGKTAAVPITGDLTP